MSHRNIPELEELLSQQEYDMKDHTVSILELNIGDLKEGSKWIGQNKVEEEKEEEQENEENEHFNDNDDEIVGMSLQEKRKLPVHQESKISNQEMKTLKDVKHEIKKTALKRVKKSKAFQQKQKMEQQKNKRQSRRGLHRTKKSEYNRKHTKSEKKSGRR